MLLSIVFDPGGSTSLKRQSQKCFGWQQKDQDTTEKYEYVTLKLDGTLLGSIINEWW
jgi:hypothetical protein